MKRIFAAVFLLGLATQAHAGFRTYPNGVPFPGFYTDITAGGPYLSSATCANTNVGNTEVRISTSPSLLHTVVVSSAGLGSPLVQLFDSYYSTGNCCNAGNTSTPTVTALTSPIDAKTNQMGIMDFDVQAASGITIRNYADVVAPCVTVTYTFRQ